MALPPKSNFPMSSKPAAGTMAKPATPAPTPAPQPAKPAAPAQTAQPVSAPAVPVSAPATSVVPTIVKKSHQARVGRFHPAEYKVQNWYHVAEAGVELDDILQPWYFAHVAHQIAPMSKITVVAEDGHFYAELLVADARHQTVITVTLVSRELQRLTRDGFKTDLHQIRYLGPELRFSVVRNADNANVKSGFADEMQAYQFLADLEKSIRMNKK